WRRHRGHRRSGWALGPDHHPRLRPVARGSPNCHRSAYGRPAPTGNRILTNHLPGTGVRKYPVDVSGPGVPSEAPTSAADGDASTALVAPESAESWGDHLDAHLAASGLTPPPGWEEAEAESARQWEA